MEAKLLKTTQAEYVAARYDGENRSGLVPFGDRVLVMPDTAAEKTAGGIIITQTSQEHQSYASETGVLVAIGDGAFVRNFDRTGPFIGAKPQIGQRVFFDRYSGGVLLGKDGVIYRVMDDKAVAGAFVG